MGFSICLYAVTTLFAGLAAQARALESLRAAGHVAAIPDQMSYAEFSQIVRLSEHQAFAHEFEP
jgi:2-methylisocitrate lyase-like PEP mutase family enzyme